MFDDLKKKLYFTKFKLLTTQGLVDKKIIPFDDEFYEKLKHTYFMGFPIYMIIKYYVFLINLGKCYERSLFMFFCLDDAILVRGDTKDLELKYGKDRMGHGWVEKNNKVYDPTTKMIYDKDLYYELYEPKNVKQYTVEDYCSIPENKKLYDDIKNTVIEDFKPHGKKRLELVTITPLVKAIAEKTGDQDFINDVNDFLALIEYDEYEVYTELQEAIKNINNRKFGLK